MKTKPMLKLLFMGLLVVGFGDVILAQHRTNHPLMKQRLENMRDIQSDCSKTLSLPDLTDKQKEQIKEQMYETRQQVMPLQNQVREKRARLQTLRTSEKVDMTAIEKIVDEMADLQAEITKQRLISEQEIRQILTDEQRLIFDSRKNRFMHARYRNHRS
jgi:Spy/CpxP family protein refolding chaperone